ncbi:uncharacterized protein LOC133815682 [Humulus lupulus]|uniref:uncharacterized protein LOC133815682 n=1 Tax=Humulus lupulus TaxID=3486 RepID=UPI002B40CDD5|nr:uncharacterized protein LOC133815682 [Humulus lupulus]
MALKLDTSKAYDWVEWSFLKAIMLRMGFSDGWIWLILECVGLVSYNVVHGGECMVHITPSRGIRQGDPLSPYLFIICADGFSGLIKKFEAMHWLQGSKVARGALVVLYMLFADGSYLYCRAIEEEANKVIELLEKFELASEQKFNLNKSFVFFSTNTDQRTQIVVLDILNMLEALERSTYFGLLSMLGRNKMVVLGLIKEKVHKRLQGWDNKFLSRAGKEILLKIVAQSLPMYAMSVFLLPLDLCKDVDRLMSIFWWHSGSAQRKCIHWKNWDKLCLHKSKGGLGFRNPRDFNLAMLGKQGWRFLSNNTSLRVVKLGARWRVGFGSSIDILGQPWLPHMENPFITTPNGDLHGFKVNSLFKVDAVEWDEDIVEDMFVQRDKYSFIVFPLILMGNLTLGIGVRSPLEFIWNELIWNNKSSFIELVVQSAVMYLEQWDNAQEKGNVTLDYSVASSAGFNEHWTKPDVGVVKVNYDAAIFALENKFGIGWLARNHDGDLIEVVSLNRLGILEPLLAEAIGMKEVLSWLKRKRNEDNSPSSLWTQNIFVETDCLVLMNALCQSAHLISPLGLVISSCKRLLNDLCNVSISFVK